MKIGAELRQYDDMQMLLSSKELDASIENIRVLTNTDVSDYSEESLVEFMKTIATANKNFKTKLISFLNIHQKHFKSEFSEWNDKNKRLIDRVERMAFDDAKDYEIDIPTGMTVSYLQVVEALNKCSGTIDFLKIISDSVEMVDSVQSSISNGSDDCEKKINGTVAKFSALSKNSKNFVDAINVAFTNSKIAEQKLFGDVFSNMDDLKKTRGILIKLDEVVRTIPNMEKQIDQLIESVSMTVDYISDKTPKTEKEYTPSAKFVKQYSNFIGLVENFASIYGNIIIKTLVVSHNITFVYNKLGK